MRSWRTWATPGRKVLERGVIIRPMERAKTILYISIGLIPLGVALCFLHGGMGLGVMIIGWVGVLFFDGPAHGKFRFGKTLEPEKPPPQQ